MSKPRFIKQDLGEREFIFFPGLVSMRVGKEALEVVTFSEPIQAETWFVYEIKNVRPRIKHVIVPTWKGVYHDGVFTWLNQHGITLTFLHEDFSTSHSFVPKPYARNGIHVRRLQYGLTWDMRYDMARDLMQRKIKGQMDNLDWLGFTEARKRLEALKEAIPKTVVERDKLMGIEGLASQIYWEALSEVPITWDKRHVLTRFMTIGERQGLIGRNGRHAIRPFHSMLNYVLGLAIVRLRIACIGLELDSDVGIYHEDDEYRESLLYDLVEPLRARLERGLIEQCQRGLEVNWFTYVAQTGRVALVADLRKRLLEAWDKELLRLAYDEVKGFRNRMVERMEAEAEMRMIN